MVGLFDTHCHLNDELYIKKWSPNDLVKEALEQRVSRMVNVSCSYKESESVVKTAAQFRDVFASIGIHPNNAKRLLDKKEINNFFLLTKHESTIAIGECGLDYFYEGYNKEIQKMVFEQQIEFAIEQNLPLIIHCREAFGDVFEILQKYRGKILGVFHCFTGNLKQAEKIIDFGFKLGFGGIFTFENAARIAQIALQIPLNSIVLETDSPYLSPHPFRGEINRPSRIVLIAQKLAKIKALPLHDVIAGTTANAFELFPKCH